MKLYLNTFICRKLMACLQAATIPLFIFSACAQDLTPVTIEEGEEVTYTSGSNFDGKEIIVNGSLSAKEIESGYIEASQLTVNSTGNLIIEKDAVIQSGLSDTSKVDISVLGGLFSSSGTIGAKMTYRIKPMPEESPHAVMNVLVDQGGYFVNDGSIEGDYWGHTNIEIREGTFRNNNQVLCQGFGSISLSVYEGGLFENEYYYSAAGGSALILDVMGGTVINNYALYAWSSIDYSSFSVYTEPRMKITVGNQGTLINHGELFTAFSCNGYINIDETGLLYNDGRIYTDSCHPSFPEQGCNLQINITGGELFNCGELSHTSDSELHINVEGGEFNNVKTVGNADVRVGKAGLMTGSGEFGSNEVSGKLIVGDGTPGLNDPALKHQSYSGDFVLRDEAQLHFYIETRENYSQVFVGGTATGGSGITAAVEVTSQMMAQSVADGWAFMNPGYVVQVDADGNETNVSDQLGIEYYGVGPYTSYYIVDPVTGSLLPRDQDDIVDAALSGTANLIDTLWSSTGAVQNFVSMALNQLKLPCQAQPRSVRDEKGNHVIVVHPSHLMRCRKLNLWGAGLGGFINMGGCSSFTYNGGGYAVGADGSFAENWRGGAAFGQSFGDFKAKHTGNKVDQQGIMFAIYAGYEKEISETRQHRASAYFSYGVVDNDARTHLLGAESGRADWEDEVFAFGLEYAQDFLIRENLTVSPFVGIEYIYGSQSIFAESFSGGMVREYDGATMQNWRIPAGVTLRHQYALGGVQYLVSDLTLGYIGDVSRRNPRGHVNIGGADFCIKGSNPARNAFMLKAGTNWLIDDHWTVGAAYNLEARSHQTAQGASAYVRYSF